MKTTPKDFFLNLGILVAIYWIVISIGVVLFNFIDLALPDSVNSWKPDQPISPFALSSIIVILPILIILSRMSRKDMQTNPEKIELKPRKWLIYLSLFVAGLVSAGDVVGIIYGLISGDLIASSFLKMIIVLVLAISSFIYLFRELKIENVGQIGTKQIMIPAIVVALILIVFGIIASNPQENREKRLDRNTVNKLYKTRSEIEFYWSQNDRLPESITEKDIEYIPASTSTYQLCAMFYKEDNTDYEWKRVPGRNCFERRVNNEQWQSINTKR